MIKIFSNEDKKILKNATIVSIILSIALTIPSLFIDGWKIGFGTSVIIGHLVSFIGYYKIVLVTIKVTNFEYQNPKKVFIFNNLTNMLMYFVALLICTMIKIFNIFLCAVGIVIIKVTIIILYGKNKDNYKK